MTMSRQKKLFDENRLAERSLRVDQFAQVVFNRPLRQAFTYAVPDDLADRLGVGKRVLAPFGRGSHRTTGFCVGLTTTAPEGTTLKPLLAVLDDVSLVSPAMLELTRWMGDYYYAGWGQVLDAVLPAAVKRQSGTRWARFYTPTDPACRTEEKLTVKQTRAFEALLQLGRPAEAREIGEVARCGPDCLKQLLKKGWISTMKRRVLAHVPRIEPQLWDTPHQLNPDQQNALDRIVAAFHQSEPKTFLLHGITGSGKTEVYLRAIDEVVRAGREAIVLVPEISLTPQTIQRFRRRFDEVAVLHSHLSDVDRSFYWQRIAAGEVQVVVGARSALFAPCPKLGLIVIDEEHETTFKQEQTPRYHAREVAIARAKLEKVPVVLGSATPSLESWHACQMGQAERLSLPNRVGTQKLPRVELLDLRYEYRLQQTLRSLSRPLAEAIRQTVDNKGQVILLLNRRGYSTTLLCPHCGHVELCQHCDLALTFHRDVQRLVCHGCDADFAPPPQCTKCGMPEIRYAGMGTERLEAEVRARFPDFTLARMDSDTMRSATQYEQVLTAFREGKIDILLGTQMIAKGLDFPNVHLVGVVSADIARNLPDFRASERTFQLIAQVAGRTGRGDNPGRVMVQTFNPDDGAIQAASHHDYLGFVKKEMAVRREFSYPPFQRLCRIILRASTMALAREAAQIVADRFRALLPRYGEAVQILGPAQAPVPKLRDMFRYHLQLQTAHPTLRQQLLDQALTDLSLPGDAELAVDVDPVSLL